MKISSFEIMESFDQLDEVLVNQVDIMKDMKAAIDQVINTSAMTGKGVDSLKTYFSDIHSQIVNGLMMVCADVDTLLYKALQDYAQEVDESKYSVLIADHIEDLVDECSSIDAHFEDLRKELKAVLNKVDDIFYSSAGYNAYECNVSSNIDTLKKDMKKVVSDLEKFDATHKNDCQSINEVLDSLNGLMDAARDVYVDNTINYDVNSPKISDNLNQFLIGMGGRKWGVR